jgi:antirestriction protein ArdC
MKTNVYDIITERIVSLIEAGTCPWRRPWNRMHAFPQNYATHRQYNGINLFLLSVIGPEVPHYLTFKQVTDLGGTVKAGAKGMPIVYWKLLKSEERDAKGDPKMVPLLRYYTVFNAGQIDGIEFPKVESRTGSTFEPSAEAERIVSGWTSGPNVEHGFSRACYCLATDEVQMPSRTSFDSAEGYYATLFHELGHSTGHESRLARKFGTSFGSEAYSREELVAEMTSAFLCAHCGIDNSTTAQQAAYLAGWVKALKGDPKLVVTAAAQAQKAANLILCIPNLDTHEGKAI